MRRSDGRTPRTSISPRLHGGFGRRAWLLAAAATAGLAAYIALSATSGRVPAAGARLSHGAVVLNSALLVFREGLEAILVLAAVTASFVGAQRARRRPVAVGAAMSFGAMIVTWIAVAAVIGSVAAPARDIEAASGLLAVAVLLVVMNWFFHRVYWTGWIAHHHRRRRDLLARHGGRALTLGLVVLGFTAVYREGFEVVLFLQTLRLKYGAAPVLEGVLLGLAPTAAVGLVTFLAERKLPYKRMLVFTGAMIGFVLIVIVGQTAQDLQEAGWLPDTGLGVAFPGWLGTWLAIFPSLETLLAQALAAAAVIGSYALAEELRVKRPARQARAETPPLPVQDGLLDPARLIGLQLDRSAHDHA